MTTFSGGRRAPEFETFDKITNINAEKGQVESEIDKTGTANVNIHTFITETENENEKTNSNTHITKPSNEKLKFESRQELNTKIEVKRK